MRSSAAEIGIPPDAVQKWQQMVDLLAEVVRVPSAVVCKLEPPHDTCYRIVAANSSDENPFPVGDTFSMDMGTFCETVIKSREPLLVVDALVDDQWRSAPETKVGMISYLGLPVAWPDGRMFGTICVLDDKSNPYSDIYQRFLLHCRDVLEGDLQTLVRLNGELEDQRTQLGELFTRVPEAVVLIDQDFRIRRINPEFTTLFDYTEEESIGRAISDILVAGDGMEVPLPFLRDIFSRDEAFSLETVLSRRDGTCLPILAVCVPVSSVHGKKFAYLICRDLTETKRFEHDQRKLQEIQLELSNMNRVATLAQLSASIAHELNQPLTGVIANCATCLQLLEGRPPDVEGLQDAVRRAKRDGDRAADVVQRLRALFSNKLPTFELVDLNEAVQEVLALMTPEIQKSGICLQSELAKDLPSAWGDRVQLQQVILNLLRNAMDAMSSIDDRTRALRIRTHLDGSDCIALLVQDSGVGISPDTLSKIFDAFYSTKVTGMGVGLAVSRSIIENHGGRLWAVANEGPGATFSFSVPSRTPVKARNNSPAISA